MAPLEETKHDTVILLAIRLRFRLPTQMIRKHHHGHLVVLNLGNQNSQSPRHPYPHSCRAQAKESQIIEGIP
jgi:hypothetical protein